MKILFLVLLVMATGYGVKITPLYWDATLAHRFGPELGDDEYDLPQFHCQFVMRAFLHFGYDYATWIPTMHKMYGGEDECIDWKEEKKLWKDIGMNFGKNNIGMKENWTHYNKMLQQINGRLGDLIPGRDSCIDMEENKYWIYHALNDNVKKGCVHVLSKDWLLKNWQIVRKKWVVKGKSCNRYGVKGHALFGTDPDHWYPGCTPNFD